MSCSEDVASLKLLFAVWYMLLKKLMLGNHFFLPLVLLPLPVVDDTLGALEVDVDVALLPLPDLMAVSCLFYKG